MLGGGGGGEEPEGFAAFDPNSRGERPETALKLEPDRTARGGRRVRIDNDCLKITGLKRFSKRSR